MWFQELASAFRRLTRTPSFSLAALLTLAISIGASTAIFSVAYNILLKPLPYPKPDQLVEIDESLRSGDVRTPQFPVNANHFVYWQQHNQSFSTLAAMLPASMLLNGPASEQIKVLQQTASLFPTLGVSPQLGRGFRREDEIPGHSKVAILADSLWHRRYGADRSVLGRIIQLEGRPYQVIGVMPPGFLLPQASVIGGSSRVDTPIEAFVPFAWTSGMLLEIEGDHNYFAIGRLKPGVTSAQAQGELTVLQHSISQQTPDKVSFGASVTGFQEYLTGSSRRSLSILLAGVGILLLISCVNVANLLLARASTRTREIAVRAALGASRFDLVIAAMAEPALLAAAGGLLGAMLATLAVPLLVRVAPPELPRLGEIHVDAVALGFAFVLAAAVALLCGAFPAQRFAQAHPEPVLRAEGNRSSESKQAKWFMNGLVLGEVAGTVALLAITGLFVVSIVRLLRVDTGFSPQHVATAQVLLPETQYAAKAQRNSFYEQALTALRQTPGVESAGLVSVLPLDGDNWGDLVSRLGDKRPLWQKSKAHFRWISPGYFESVRIPLLAGRYLTDTDRDRSVALISAQVAREVWPGQNAIGQHFLRGNPNEKPFEVIGVVGDIHTLDLDSVRSPMVYVPYWYRSRNSAAFTVRGTQNPERLMTTMRRVLSGLDPELAVTSLRTMNVIVSSSVATRRFEMQLLLSFALTALLLSGLGIYGVVEYSTRSKTYEIGIRMAVGADTAAVRRLILWEGLRPVVLGIPIGIGSAWLFARALASLLFQVSPFDPLVGCASGTILLIVGGAACLLPATRAATMEPLEALRSE